MNKITFRFLDPKTIPFDLKDGFEFRKDKKYHLVQKLCFWVLKRIGAFYISHRVDIKTVEIDPKKIMSQQIMEQINWHRRYTGKEPETIVMGSKNFAELMNQKDQCMAFEHPMSRAYCFADNDRDDGKWYGIKIKVVPHIDGVFTI